MKARSAGISLYHMSPGHHRDTAMWHDGDHKAEVIGSMPHVYLSQRWVSPPEWMSLRPPTDLAHDGGEYVNVYWSSATPHELSDGFRRLGDELTAAGRMRPLEYMKRVWPMSGGSLHPILVEARPGLEISGQAAAASTMSTGLVTSVEELRGPGDVDAFSRWHESEYIPMVLDSKLFSAAAKFGFDEPELRGTSLTLFYVDQPSPDAVYREFSELAADWTGRNAPPGGGARRTLFESVSRPSIGHYDFYE